MYFATVFSGLTAYIISGDLRVAAVAALGGLLFDFIFEAIGQRERRKGK